MMTLAERAVACKHWRWLPGTAGENRDGRFRVGKLGPPDHFPDLVNIPDMSDPATLGCMLALVREAWGERIAETLWVTPPGRGRFAPKTWMVWSGNHVPTLPSLLGRGASEAEALVAALEAAP